MFHMDHMICYSEIVVKVEEEEVVELEDYDDFEDSLLEPRVDHYELAESQAALEEVLKELDRYKLNHELKSEGTYWSTLVKEGVPKWGLVDAVKDFFEPFLIPEDLCENDEQLNTDAVAEIMAELNQKAAAEEVVGVTAWKTRHKVNKMFLARTIKVLVCLLSNLSYYLLVRNNANGF